MIDKEQNIYENTMQEKTIFPSKELLELKILIDELNLNYIEYEKSTLEKEKIKAEEFLRSKFNLNNIKYLKIKFLRPKKLLDFLEIVNPNYIFKIYQNLPEIDPFELPILLGRTNEIKRKVILNNQIERNLEPINECIILEKDITIDTSSIIVHEITHSQERHNNFETQYINCETIPIFLEMLYKVEAKTFNVNDILNLRFNELSYIITNLAKYKQMYLLSDKTFYLPNSHTYSKYLKCTLNSLQLLNLYLESPSKKQRFILDEIQKIFDKKQTIEELIETLGINEQQEVKRLVKILKE